MDENQRRLDAIRRGSDGEREPLHRRVRRRPSQPRGVRPPRRGGRPVDAAHGGDHRRLRRCQLHQQLAGVGWQLGAGQAGRHDQGRHRHAHRRRSTRSPSPTRAAWTCSARRASTWPSRTRRCSSCRCWPKAGAPTPTRRVWTFKIRQGVKFHNGQPLTADDVVYTVQAADRPQGLVERPERVRRCAAARRGAEGGQLHRRLPPRGAERELPVPVLVGQLQHDHPAEQLRPVEVGVELHRHRAVQDEELHPQGRAPRSSATRPTGARRRFPTAPSSPSTTPSSPRSWRCRGGHDRRGRPVLGVGRPGAALELEGDRDQPEVERPPRALDALRPGAVHRPPRPPGGGADPEPARDHPGPVPGQGRPRQRQPVRAGLPSTDTSVPQRAQGPRPRPSSSCRRRGTGAASRPSSSPRTSSRSRSSPRSSSRRRPRSASTSGSRSRRRRSTTARPSSASPTGWTAP